MFNILINKSKFLYLQRVLRTNNYFFVNKNFWKIIFLKNYIKTIERAFHNKFSNLDIEKLSVSNKKINNEFVIIRSRQYQSQDNKTQRHLNYPKSISAYSRQRPFVTSRAPRSLYPDEGTKICAAHPLRRQLIAPRTYTSTRKKIYGGWLTKQGVIF